MTYKFIIIFVFVYVLQFGILKNIYLFDKGSFRIAKAINLLISVFIFWTISSNGNNFFTMLNDYGSFRDNIYIDAGAISPNINFVAKILSNLLDIVLFVTAFNLSRRSAKYRKVFLTILPLWAILWTIDINRFFFLTYGSDYEYSNYIIWVGFIITLIQFVPIYLIYNSNVFKIMMCFDNEKIKETVKGSA